MAQQASRPFCWVVDDGLKATMLRDSGKGTFLQKRH